MKGSVYLCLILCDLEEYIDDVVAMYENSPDASMKQVSKDLGVSRCALGNWVARYGTGDCCWFGCQFSFCVLGREGRGWFHDCFVSDGCQFP